MTLSRRTAAGLLLGLFVLAFVLRAYHPISPPPQWYKRSLLFQIALTHHRTKDTALCHYCDHEIAAPRDSR